MPNASATTARGLSSARHLRTAHPIATALV
jgi:hypothetical protein